MAKLTWVDDAAGLFNGWRSVCHTRIGVDLTVIMRRDDRGRALGFRICLPARNIDTNVVSLMQAKDQAESAFEELLRDQLGVME